jgi:hypothetical protein
LSVSKASLEEDTVAPVVTQRLASVELEVLAVLQR